MDIDEFYDADERRRRSAEVELGIDWQDEVFERSCLTHAGAIRHEPTAKLVGT